MSSEAAFRCPVCRAAQPLCATCRRCQADLELVVRARSRLSYLATKYEAARASGDQELVAKLRAELRWLAPANVNDGQ